MERASPLRSDLQYFLDFIKRSAPPLHTIEIKCKHGHNLTAAPPVFGYFLPSVTNILVTTPHHTFFNIFWGHSLWPNTPVILPGLKHLEITDCEDRYLEHFFAFVKSRWDIDAPHRALESVRLKRCFRDSSMPAVLSSPRSAAIDLTHVAKEWREIARCVNEGLVLSVCE